MLLEIDESSHDIGLGNLDHGLQLATPYGIVFDF